MHSKLRLQLRELRELGLARAAFRIRWEAETRSGLRGRKPLPPVPLLPATWTSRLPFAEPQAVVDAVRDRILQTDLERLRDEAQAARQGRIRAFGAFEMDYGSPPDWFVNPMNGRKRDPNAFWSKALNGDAGDIKLTWEIARFPHAYAMARAAAFFPAERDALATSLLEQVVDFDRSNVVRRGPHWASAQELAIRNVAWTFALATLLDHDAAPVVARSLHNSAQHTLDVIEYAEKAVYNNHLLSEALGLYLAGALLTENEPRAKGRHVLEAQAVAQFYDDGGYILLSLNYERAALQLLTCACVLARVEGSEPAPSWLAAMDRALSFMVAHQNPTDGRMPNVGPNDGSLPCILSTCDILDFRPTLQAVSVLARGERIYEPGPWDEEVVWWLGPQALDAPLRRPVRRSMSFRTSGFHVLRAAQEGTFTTFRCGTLPDRFGQMDMLHVDIWWRGQNVAVDAGTFMYDVDEPWLRYFDGTSSHNTITIDDEDQMILFRRFKHLYPTRALLDAFHSSRASGEHFGYERLPGSCVHRRTVELNEERVVVTDDVRGSGVHRVRLHWLLGEFPFEMDRHRIVLTTPTGAWGLEVRDGQGKTLPLDVVVGSESPPRGWLSRYYAHRGAAPSVSVTLNGALPLRLSTITDAV